MLSKIKLHDDTFQALHIIAKCLEWPQNEAVAIIAIKECNYETASILVQFHHRKHKLLRKFKSNSHQNFK